MTPAPESSTAAETLRRAYLTIQLLKRKVDESERARREPVAVVGIGCRFPGGAIDAASYWNLLSGGVDAVREIPPDRWDVEEFYDGRPQQQGRTTARAGGFLDHIDHFDHEFFGISHREALEMDPQQRLTLEVAWEALENAGQSPKALAGSQTGVFVAVCTSDFAMTHAQDPLDVTAHTTQGTAHSAVPGIVSYALDLRGPSLAVDTACSSSLVALHLASQSLRSGECDLALGGGVNVIMSPLTSIAFSQAGMLSRKGRSRPFDAEADGPINGEGCGVVVLKRLSDAHRDGDRVLAVLLGSAVNHNGRGSAFTAPSSVSQREVIRTALRASGVPAGVVSYVEAHGSSTPVGDVMEVDALADVYGRTDGTEVLVGTVKGNLGHLQAAGGIAGLIKVVLSIQHGAVPGTLNLDTVNPELDLAGTRLVIPAETTSWPALPGERVAGVSTFGFTGTNAHLIVGEAPGRPASDPDESRPQSVLALSATTAAALARLAGLYAERLTRNDGARLADICYSANTGRSHFPHRLAVVGESAAQLASQLRAFSVGPGSTVRAPGARTSDVVFVFPGQHSWRAGTAAVLFQSQPTFRRMVEECDEILLPALGRSILPAFRSEHPDPSAGGTGLARSSLFAIEFALAQLWRSWGVEPAAVVGQGLGEYVAACVAGTMSLPDALHLVASHSLLVAEPTLLSARIAATEQQVAAAIIASGTAARVAIAAVGGPTGTVITGDREVVQSICASFGDRGVATGQLGATDAGHCSLAEPLLPTFRRSAKKIQFSAPRIPLVSTVTGELWPWQEPLDADHWCRHLRLPARLAASMATLATLGYRTLLEVGPGGSLTRLGPQRDHGTNDPLPSLGQGKDDWQVLLTTLGGLYACGAPVDWSEFDRDYPRTKLEVPTYPFQPTQCRPSPADRQPLQSRPSDV